jgi:hypothetical protein
MAPASDTRLSRWQMKEAFIDVNVVSVDLSL